MLSLFPFLSGVVIFGMFHSFFAQEWMKSLVAKILSQFFVDYIYRSLYSYFSWFLFYRFTFYLSRYIEPSYFEPLFHVNIYYTYLELVMKCLAVILLYWALLQYNFLEFIGLKQLWNGLMVLLSKKNLIIPSSLAGNDRLEIRGIYSVIRNPMMVAGILLALPRIFSVFSVLVLLSVIVYVLIGTHYEKKRLLRNFGPPYQEYINSVGAFLPKFSQLKRWFKYV